MPEPESKRGRIHDAQGAREAILDAAEEVFAEHGFDGARVDHIANVSGYNKSLVFQYYGDKLALYAAVIRRADEQTRAMQNDAISTFMNADASPMSDQIRDFLAGFVGWYFDYLLEHPRIMRIYLWEMAEGWQTFCKVVTQRDFDDVVEFAVVLNKLQSAGILRSTLNPLLQLSPALLVSLLPLALLPLYQVLLPDGDFSSPTALAHTREFVIKFVVNGLLVTPEEAKA